MIFTNSWHLSELNCSSRQSVRLINNVGWSQSLYLQEYDYISSKRIEYFCSSKPLFHQFTILVRAIPASPGRNISDTVENFFTEHHPSTYLSHTVVRRTSKLRGLIVSFRLMFHLMSFFLTWRKKLVSGKQGSLPQSAFLMLELHMNTGCWCT